jgi:Ca2+-binding EF-hand superfamily protein
MSFDLDLNELEQLLPKNFDEIAKQSFKNYDSDKNGALDVNELYNLLVEIGKDLGYPDKVTLEDAREGIKALDLNENNVLEYDEFKRLFAALYIIKQSQ